MTDAARSALEVLEQIRRDRETADARTASVRHRHISTAPGRIDDLSKPHPRGLHVPCGHCRRPAGSGCERPAGRTPAGFVHPTRLDDEQTWWEAQR